MKKFSKILSVALLVALVLSLGVSSAFAADIVVTTGTTAGDGTESQDVLKGEAYAAYKILNYTASDTNNDNTNDAYSYYLTAAQYDADNAEGLGKLLEGAGFHFTASADGSQYFVDNADSFTEENVKTLSGYLYTNKEKVAAAAIASATATASSNKQAVFSGLDTGYWFVTSSTGALCSLQSYNDEAMIVEKNTIPTIDKKERIDRGLATPDEYVDGPVNGNIGDTVNYQIVVTDGVGTNAKLTVTDTMSDGLTYTANTLKINGTAVADDANTDNWKVTVAGQTITIEFTAAYVASLADGGTITITFDATINDGAVIGGDGNENKAELDYSNQHSEDKVYVKTFDINLNKIFTGKENDNTLEATFALYGSVTTTGEGNTAVVSKAASPLTLVEETKYEKYVRPDTEHVSETNTTITVKQGTTANIRGLAAGTYFLTETDTEDGFNMLATDIKVVISDNGTVTYTIGEDSSTGAIDVTNNSGTVLPSTGGIGTTIFYVVGGVLVLAAIILLVTKKRMSE